MRVLIITSAFPKDLSESQGIIIARLVQSLSKKGIHTCVLAPHGADIPFIYHLYKAKIYRFPYFIPFRLETLVLAPGIFFHLRISVLAKIQLLSLLVFETIAIMKICRREGIDIIHSHWILPHGLPGIIAAYFLNIPHICSIHGTDVTITKSYPLLIHLVRFIAKRCSVLSVNSQYTLSITESICVAIPGVVRIPMGVDLPFKLPNQLESKFQERNEQIILYVGRLIQWKGIHILIRSMKNVQKIYPYARLFIIGDGICQDKLQELRFKLKLEDNVFFMGRVSEEELNNWFKKASVFVLPSIMHNNQTEGLGVVLLEAMAVGVPVIGSNIGGIPDIVENGVNGLLVPPGDSDALADAIIRIFENLDLAERFRVAGLETVRKRFSWDSISEQFIDLYQKVLKDLHHV